MDVFISYMLAPNSNKPVSKLKVDHDVVREIFFAQIYNWFEIDDFTS